MQFGVLIHTYSLDHRVKSLVIVSFYRVPICCLRKKPRYHAKLHEKNDTLTYRPRMSTSDIGFFGMIFVGPDDHLDQFVAYHVLVGEVDNLNAIQIGKYSLRFNQPTAFASRQIHLRNVPGYHGLRSKPDTR